MTLCNVHCQLGERRDLDAVCGRLPEDVVVNGWLGGSLLVRPSLGFDEAHFCKEMEALKIFITPKPLPTTAEEYFQVLYEITGTSYDQSELTSRQTRRIESCKYASDWMEVKLEKPTPMHHLDFAVAIDDAKPRVYNPFAKKAEYYSKEDGVWYPDGGALVTRGELFPTHCSRYSARGGGATRTMTDAASSGWWPAMCL